jgi:hypothetical protein
MAETLRRRMWGAVGRVLTRRVREAHSQDVRPGTPALSSVYPGDYEGLPQITYAPHEDAYPDPGEVAWGWVPFEEDYQQGKDRPILMIGRDGDWLLGLPLTSKDHNVDRAQENAEGRYWVDIGSGDWDTRRRHSEVRVDRIIRVDPTTVRRTGGKIDRARFARVAAGLRQHWDD